MQYFLPFASEGINKHIEEAILRADKMGVKVISLAALNKVFLFDHNVSFSIQIFVVLEGHMLWVFG